MGKEKILIAEDEGYTRDTLSFVLENAGYHVIETENGNDALHEVLRHHHSTCPIDLMILDVEMPGLTGWQLLKELQRQQVSLPTIVITGLTDDQQGGSLRKAAAVEYLKKPFTPDSLIACVSAVLHDDHDQRAPEQSRA